MFTIRKDFPFEAAHQLAHLPADHQCSRFHGHSYVVTVELQARDLDADGFVVDYGLLADVKRFVDERLDHRFLNEVVGGSILTTAENLASWLFREWYPLHPELRAVAVKETAKTWAEYRPAPPRPVECRVLTPSRATP